MLSAWNDLSIRFAMIETIRRAVHKAKSKSIRNILVSVDRKPVIHSRARLPVHPRNFTHFTYSAKSAFCAKDTRWYILIGTGISRVPRRVVHDPTLGWTARRFFSCATDVLIRRLGHVGGHVGPRENILHRHDHQLRRTPSDDVCASWNRNAFRVLFSAHDMHEASTCANLCIRGVSDISRYLYVKLIWRLYPKREITF